MNRREFLKKSLEGIVIGSIPLISSCGKNPVSYDLESRTKIAFSSKKNGIYNIYTMNPDGSDLKQLTYEGENTFPAWSPGEEFSFYKKIAFASNFEICIMDMYGTYQENLTNPKEYGVQEGHPTWSPNGIKIAFSSNMDGKGEIYVIDIDGTNLTRLTFGENYNNFDPDWSPDGKKIVFSSNMDGIYNIYTMNPDGSDLKQLTYEFWNRLPAWSPDGKIAFMSRRDGPSEIYVMNADGSEQRNLTNNPDAYDYHPGWSPDGKKIVFSSYRTGNYEIYVMNAVDGTNLTRLTFNEDYNNFGPAWSPFLK